MTKSPEPESLESTSASSDSELQEVLDQNDPLVSENNEGVLKKLKTVHFVSSDTDEDIEFPIEKFCGVGAHGAVYIIRRGEELCALKYSSQENFKEESKTWNNVMHDLGGEYEKLACSTSIERGYLKYSDGTKKDANFNGLMIMPCIKGETVMDFDKKLSDFLEEAGCMKKPNKADYSLSHAEIIKAKRNEGETLGAATIRVRKDGDKRYMDAMRIYNESINAISNDILANTAVCNLKETLRNKGYKQTDDHLGNYMVSDNGLVIPIDMGTVKKIELPQEYNFKNEEIISENNLESINASSDNELKSPVDFKEEFSSFKEEFSSFKEEQESEEKELGKSDEYKGPTLG